MRERLRFLILYYSFWVVVFLFARFLFLSYHIQDTRNLTLDLLFGLYKNGLRMDLAMAAYYSIFPFLWVSFSNYINKSVFQNTIFSYTFVLFTITNLIVVADMEVYSIWNFRLDSTPLKFLSTPKEALISVKNSPILRLLLSYILLLALGAVVVYRIVANKIYDWKKIKTFPFVLYGIVCTLALLIPLRGGWGKEALRQSSVYFSKNHFANAAALNAPWNFFSSLLKKGDVKENPYSFYPREVVDRTLDTLFSKSGARLPLLASKSKTNVLVIFVENLSAKALDYSFHGQEITPYLNRLKKESVYFSQYYSSSDRTDKTIVSTLSGFPSQPRDALTEYSDKVKKLPFLSSFLFDKGFSTRFYYGGEPDFLGLKDYLFASRFEKLSLRDDYITDAGMSALGAADSLVYARVLEEHTQNFSKPFFSAVLTLSSHEPYGIPAAGSWSGTQTLDQYYNALNYADKSLGEFLEKAKNTAWWENTLVVILGSHGHKWPETAEKTDNFRVPMFWTGGVIKQYTTIDKIGSQLDFPATLLGQIGLQNDAFTWSRDVLDPKTPSWAFFVFNDGFGYVGKQKVMFDNVGRIGFNVSDSLGVKSLERGKVLMQSTYQSFLNL
jgi:phosphoglycerol transferase MdoB-like AlkP superfamily enzyme